MLPLEKIGKEIQWIRKKKGITQRSLAEMTGMSRKIISDVEKGRRRLSVLEFKAITHALDVSPDTFLEEENTWASLFATDSKEEEYVNELEMVVKSLIFQEKMWTSQRGGDWT